MRVGCNGNAVTMEVIYPGEIKTPAKGRSCLYTAVYS
jgi:hypothetical protein